METMNIALPDSLKRFVQRRVARSGYGSVSEYMRELIRADFKRAAQEHLEQEILRGVDSGPSVEMTPHDWQSIRQEANRRATKSAARPVRR